MPDGFFEEINPNQLTLVTHYLMGFDLQDYLCHIQLKDRAFVLILDSPDADLKVLKKFHFYGIRNYQTFVSNAPPPFKGLKQKLRVAMVVFTSCTEQVETTCDLRISKEQREDLFKCVKKQNVEIDLEEFNQLICGIDSRFLRSLTHDRLVLALLMFFRARDRDHCQYEIRYNEDWKKKGKSTPSVQIVFAWRNTPKYRFIYLLAKMIFRHQLNMVRVTAAYVQPYEKNSILVMSGVCMGSKARLLGKKRICPIS